MRAAWLVVGWLGVSWLGQAPVRLDRLPPAPKHLTAVASTGAPTVAPGGTLSLRVDIVPNPGIHIYAPGAKGYAPITLTVGTPKDAVLGPTHYPPSRLWVTGAESVPAYQSAFQLTRDVTVARSVKVGAPLVLSGTLDYQACDATICFVPATLSVSWNVVVR
jgi:DsbC/DsbD-like thiol-disulfide interchange protein